MAGMDADDNEPNFDDFKISTCDKVKIYILNTIGCTRCCSNKTIRALKKKIEHGEEHLEEDFNIKVFIK